MRYPFVSVCLIAIRIVSGASPDTTQADNSGYSALVRVGKDPHSQEILLDLNFVSDESLLYEVPESPSSCSSPLVNFFHHETSPTFQEVWRSEDGDEWVGSDFIALGGDSVEFANFEFLRRRISHPQPDLSVGGWLGLSQHSAIAKSRVMVVSAESPGGRILINFVKHFPMSSPPGIGQVAFALAPRSQHWSLSARIQLNGIDVFGRAVPIGFDPSIRTVSIPSKGIDALIAAVGLISESYDIDSEGFLLLPCRPNKAFSVKLRMQIVTSDGGKRVTIALSENGGSRRFNPYTGSFMCKTEIVVRSDNHPMVLIGDVVFRKRRLVAFDAISSRIIFQSWANGAVLRSLEIGAGHLLASRKMSLADEKINPVQIPAEFCPIDQGYALFIGIGTPPQQIHVVPDFGLATSRIYISSNCPPFVECFSEKESTSYRNHDHTETFQFGSQTFEGINFSFPGLLPRFKAGALGLSPKSQIMKQSVVVVSQTLIVDSSETEKYNHGLAFEVLPSLPETSFVDTILPIVPDMEDWVITGRLALNDYYVFGSSIPIALNPSIPRVLLRAHAPLTNLRLIEPAADIDEAGRLVLPCNSFPKLEIIVGNGERIPIQLPTYERKRYLDESSQIYMCLYEEIVLDDGAAADEPPFLFIGSAVVNQRQSVIFDGRESRIIFRSRAADEKPLKLQKAVSSRIPTFSDFDLVRQDEQQNGNLYKLQFQGKISETDDGYWLNSLSPRADNTRGSLMYYFFRSSKITPPVTIRLPGRFQLVALDRLAEIDNKTGLVVSIPLKQAQAASSEETVYEVIVQKSSSNLVVALRPVTPVPTKVLYNGHLTIGIGSPLQQVTVIPNFHSAWSVLYTSSSCPPFVKCFSETESSTFSVDSQQIVSTDTLQVGSQVFERIDFKTAEADNPNLPLFRAGIVGLSPRSEIMRDSVMVFSKSRNIFDSNDRTVGVAVELLGTLPSDYQELVFVETILSIVPGVDAWAVEGNLLMNGVDMFGGASRILAMDPFRSKVSVVLDSPDILPAIAGTFHWDASQQGHVFLPCGLELTLEIVTTSGTVPIHISPSKAREILVEETGLTWCFNEELSLRVIPGASQAVAVGLPVLYNRHSLIFDGIESRIIFRSLTTHDHSDEILSLQYVDENNIPFFNLDSVAMRGSSDGTVLNIDFHGTVTYNPKLYFLTSVAPTQGPVPGSLEYTFESVGGIMRPNSRSLDLTNLFHLEGDGSLQLRDKTIASLALVRATSMDKPIYEVSLYEFGIYMKVQLMPVLVVAADPGELQIEATNVELEDGEEPTDCAICFEQIVPGTAASLISRCKHRFHSECINRWVSQRKANCPLCAQAIPVFPGGRLRKPQP